MSNRTVLVAGGTGLIGSHVLRELLHRGGDHLRSTQYQKPPVVVDDRITYVRADLTSREDCIAAVRGVDRLFVCAANTSGAAVMANNPVAHITTNLLINAQLFEAAANAGVRDLLFISSSSVYPPGPQKVKESEAFDGDPHETYFGVGWMKRYTEKLAAFYHQRYGMRVAIVRPSNTYGPHDKFDPERSHVLPALIRRAVAGEDPFTVWGDGSAVRDFIYVEDLARALVDVMDATDGLLTINIGSGRTVTIRECVELILRLTGRQSARVVYDTSKPTTIPARDLDLGRSRDLLGTTARVDFTEGLRRTIAWFTEQRSVEYGSR